MEEINLILNKFYGIKGNIKALVGGYDDKNFLIESDSGEKFILKLSKISKGREIINAHNEVLQYLNDNNSRKVSFPLPIKSLNNELINEHKLENDENVLVRMLSFIDGTFLSKTDITRNLLFDFGSFLGYMDNLLKKLDFKYVNTPHFEWDLQNFSEIENLTHHIQSPEDRSLIQYYFIQFRTFIEPLLKKLDKSIIHNDANDLNILTNNHKICGIIDFGDMVYSQTINELAIGITYAVIDSDKPIDDAVEIIRGYNSEIPLRDVEMEILYYLICARLSASITLSTYTRNIDPDNEYISISEKPAWALLRKLIQINPLFAENKFKNACGLFIKPRRDIEKLLSKRFNHISKGLSISYSEPIKMFKAAFQYMYDEDGKTYLDCANNICHVGHCHPKVVKAAQKQIATLNTNTRYIYDQLNEYTSALCSTFPSPLNKVFLVNSGSAATDLALRLAKTYTNNNEIIAVKHGYHGNTISAINVSHYKYGGKGGKGKASYVHEVDIPDTYRGKYRADDKDAGLKYSEEIKEITENKNNKIAAFICESIIGCGGQVMLPELYLSNVYKSVRNAGGLNISDEVQVGFGRVGTHMWGFEMYDVIPDIVILGKPIGNGHPLAAVVTTNEIAASFDNGMEFFSSFGGNPVSCIIGKSICCRGRYC
ncbi:aminotransferase class III-fold pyridoxal phosphate-dependent enzyme [Bacteroidota bacterium]